jgi:hypothetical protein
MTSVYRREGLATIGGRNGALPTRRRLCEALKTLDAIAQPAPGVRNIPL